MRERSARSFVGEVRTPSGGVVDKKFPAVVYESDPDAAVSDLGKGKVRLERIRAVQTREAWWAFWTWGR